VVDVEMGLLAGNTTAPAGLVEPSPGLPLAAVLDRIVAADIAAMRETAAQLDLPTLARAARMLAGARRVDICGTGDSALVGAQLQACLHGLGVAAWFWQDLHAGLASAATLTAEDVAFGVSHSGRCKETVEILAEAASRGARTIALTGSAGSPLAGVADLVLVTAAPPAPQQPAAMLARHPELMVLDLLTIAVAQHLAGAARQRATGRP
jgi:DNA-binding MurR/RpiR family transcriptional regulator